MELERSVVQVQDLYCTRYLYNISTSKLQLTSLTSLSQLFRLVGANRHPHKQGGSMIDSADKKHTKSQPEK